MAIADDWTIDAVNNRVYHSSGTTVYSVNALYSWLESTFSGSGFMQYKPPMSASTPVNYTMINGWFIDEASLQYLKTGGISTSGWTSTVYVLQFGSTYTNAISTDIGKTVVQGSNNGTLLAYDNTNKRWWVRVGTGTIIAGVTTITSGTGAGTSTSVTNGEALFSNVYTLGAPLQTGTQMYISQGTNNVITSYWPSGHIDLVIPVKRADVSLNSGFITVYAREWGNTYNYYTIDLSAGGRNPVPISTTTDVSITDTTTTVSGFTGITLTYGTVSKNLNNGSGSKNYDLVINCNSYSVKQIYEYLQYITVRGTTSTTLTNGTQGQLYLALSNYTPIASASFGTFAGGKFFGAQGVWLENMATSDVQNFQLIASDGSTQIPPNIVNVSVTGLVSGDQVMVARSTGSGSTTINFTQYTLSSSGNGSGSGTVTVSGSIGSDEPSTGTLRIKNSSGTYDRYAYTSWTGSTFTISGTLSSNYNSSTMFVPLIDTTAASTTATNSLIYSSNINVVARVRKYASGVNNSILPFETSGTVTSTGYTVSAIRTIDSVAA
jgi:hypothetical protein